MSFSCEDGTFQQENNALELIRAHVIKANSKCVVGKRVLQVNVLLYPPITVFLFLFQKLFLSQQIFTLIALMPPVVIAVFVHDVSQLVALTVSTAIASFLLFN